MGALVVYESVFGNTRQVAGAIAAGLAEHCRVRLEEVEHAPCTCEGVDLLVVGGPTHVHVTEPPRTRMAPTEQSEDELVSTGEQLQDWMLALPDGNGLPTAAFDTRIHRPEWLTGSAAHGIIRRLRRKGYATLDQESFLVDEEDGVLDRGELDRARAWGRELAVALLPHDAPAGPIRVT
jgi:flavodoxin